MGLRASNTVSVALEGVRLPADHLVGDEGRGFAYAMEARDVGRLGTAIVAVGIARRALDQKAASNIPTKSLAPTGRGLKAPVH